MQIPPEPQRAAPQSKSWVGRFDALQVARETECCGEDDVNVIKMLWKDIRQLLQLNKIKVEEEKAAKKRKK